MWLAAIILYLAVMLYYRYRPLPAGINGRPRRYPVDSSQARFLYDLTRYKKGRPEAEQHILKAYRDGIRQARSFILLDIFLFNRQKADPDKHLPVTGMIISDLKDKRIPRYFITDPLNIGYGTDHCQPLYELEQTGTKVVFTDLDKLPDGNLVYSPIWRLFFQWFGARGRGTIPNPLRRGRKTTLRALLKGFNIKANHRKLLAYDDTVLVSSSNLHDSSSYYSNTGLLLKDRAVAAHFYRAEAALAHASGHKLLPVERFFDQNQAIASHDATAMPLMGAQIKVQVLDDLRNLRPGDRVVIGMLFLAQRRIISLLKKKARAGVDITVILDNNRVSFDQKKVGLPNQYLAPELARAGIKVYMFKDVENEYHAKFLYIKKGNKAVINTGSANFTRRSLVGTNLENNLRLSVPAGSSLAGEVEEYVKKITSPEFSVLFQKKPKFYLLGYLWLRLAERTGLASW